MASLGYGPEQRAIEEILAPEDYVPGFPKSVLVDLKTRVTL